LNCGKYSTEVRSGQSFRSARKWGHEMGEGGVSLSLRKTGLFVPKPSPRRISRRWSCCNSKEQPSCYGCSSNIKPQRSDRSLILEHLVGGHKQGGEIGAEYLAAESVRASASYDHSTIDQCRGFRLKFRMLLVLCFLESGD
jgi:hypothetical protein